MNTQYYIPAGQEIVVQSTRDGQPTGQYQWYTTTKRVEVKEWNTGLCPVRNAITVLTAETNGRQIWFLENQLKVELSQDMKTVINTTKLVKLEYDIPARVSNRPQDYQDENGRPFEHPSQYLWNYGVRTSLSMWVVPESKIPWRRLNRLTRQGCIWEQTPIDASVAAKLLSQSVVNLRKEWVSALQSYNECMASAAQRRDRKIENANGQNDIDKANRQYRYDCTRVEKDLTERQENIKKGASVLRIPEQWITADIREFGAVGNGTVATFTQANRAVGQTRARAHVAAVDSLQRAGQTAVANAVEQGDMPHDIAQDYAEDNEVEITDDDGNTYNLRDVFSDDDNEEVTEATDTE